MATYTVDQWIAKMDTRLKELSDDKLMIPCIQGTIAEYIPRIFDAGIKSDGTDIGEYSTKPTVISSENSPQKFKDETFVPFSKAKRQTTGKKGFYGKEFEGGYKEFKSFIGRGSRVNLRLFNNLQSDAASVFLVKENGGIAYKLKREENGNKREWMEKKYGKIFDLTAKEKEQYIACYKEAVLKKLKE